MTTFATTLREARKLKGWSQDDLSYHSGISPTGISRLESGEYDPLPKTFDKLLKALKLTHDQLMGRKPLPGPTRFNVKWRDPMVQEAWEECQGRREKRDRGELPPLGQRRTPQVAKRMLG